MRTSRLSLAAITALGITTASLSAGELVDIALPDGQWKMIGVNGAFSGASTALDTPTATGREDSNGIAMGSDGEVNDNLFTDLLESGGTNAMVKFKVVDSGLGSEPTGASMTISTEGKTYDGTAAVKTMYVSANGTGYGDIHILYQADFEGDTFEVSVDYGTDTTSYTGTFESNATAAKPGRLTVVSGSAAGVNISDAIDANMSNNPGIETTTTAKEDFTASNRDSMDSANDALKVFNFDAGSNAWKSYAQSGTATTGSGDFTQFEPGKAYWVKLTDGDASDTGAVILGTGGITSTTYSDFKENGYLSAGWNMLSFNDSALREASTGLIITLDTAIASDSTLKIADAFGYQEVSVTLVDADETNASKSITAAIESAKDAGDLSKGFGLKAFPAGSSKVALLSDRQFRIYDTNASGSTVGTVTTIGGQDPYYLGSSSYTSIPDLDAVGAVSRYGEFSLIITPNDGGSGSVSVGIGKMQINTNTPVDVNSTLSQVVTDAMLDSDIDNATELDLDFDGTTDSILLVDKDDRFYVKDSVFTRVYEVNASENYGASTIYFDGNETAVTVTTTANDQNASTVAIELNASNTFLQMDANATWDQDDNDTLIVFTDNVDYKNFRLIDDPSRDILTPSTSDSNLTTGAIKEVYSIENLTKAVWNNSEKIYKLVFNPNFSTDTDQNDTNLSFGIWYKGLEYNLTLLSAYDEGNLSDGINVPNELNITSGASAYNALDGNSVTLGSNVSYADYNDTNTSMYISAVHTDIDTGEEVAQLTGHLLNKAINDYDFGDANGTDTENTPLTALRIRQGENVVYISVPGCDNSVGDFNVTENNDTLGMLTIVEPDANGSCEIGSIPSLTGDLKYNPVYAQDFQTDTSAPLFKLRSTGFKALKLLSPVENGSGGISWSYIDLTKNSGEWFNPVDNYTLFRTDKERGYWVYLEEADDAEIVIGGSDDSGTFSFTPMYKHSFNNDANVTDGLKSYSMLTSTSISTEISGLEQSAGGNSNVQVVINGNIIPMSKSGNLYTADATVDGLATLAEGELPVDVRVYDEAGNYFTQTMTYFDNQQPTAPTMNDDATITSTTFSSTDGDGEKASGVGAYFIYSSDINESNLSQNLVAKVFNGETTIYKDGDTTVTSTESGEAVNLCSIAGGTANNFELETGWKVFAIDGGTDRTNSGVVDYNLVSDLLSIGDDLTTTTTEEGWIPVYKGTSVLVAGGDTGSNTDGIPTNYDVTCTASDTAATTDNGVSIQSVDGNKVAMAYRGGSTTLSNAGGVGSIITTYVSDASSNLAKITFDGNSYYKATTADANATVAIELGGVVYSTQWSDLNNSGTGYPTTSSTFELNDTTKAKKTAFPSLTIE